MLINSLPPILVLHLKRFWYDEAAGGVIKIGKPVLFLLSLTSHSVRFLFSYLRQPRLKISHSLRSLRISTYATHLHVPRSLFL